MCINSYILEPLRVYSPPSQIFTFEDLMYDTPFTLRSISIALYSLIQTSSQRMKASMRVAHRNKKGRYITNSLYLYQPL